MTMVVDYFKFQTTMVRRASPKVMKLFLCPTELSMEFTMLINVKIPMCTASRSLKASKVIIFHHITLYEQLKFHAQLS